MTGLGATPQERTCSECGEGYIAHRAHGDFCSRACRRVWNNRRSVRGAELYDLVMALRFDRAMATKFKVWKLICRMASGFRDEDERERTGRQSWRAPHEIIARHPYLRADVLANNVAGARR